MSRRDLSRYEDETHPHGSLESFLTSPVHGGIHTIDYNGSPLDLWVRPRLGAKTLIVIFHGAVTADATTPMFTGVGVTMKVPAHVVLISDPSLELSPSLRLAWFGGNYRQPLQRDLPRLLTHVLDSLGARHVVFYGASLGGFASLYYSAQFPGSLAVPINPQTDLAAYSKHLVNEYAQTCWPDSGGRERLHEWIESDLRALYSQTPDNTIAYMQNLPDSHTRDHFLPFAKSLPANHRVSVLLGEWARGHQPPPKVQIAQMLRFAANCGGDWQRFLAEFGFVSASAAVAGTLTSPAKVEAPSL